ncbi:MAG TPA: imidazoleglycerol-phosphate dehydratase HisB [Aggregatilinea sp.]|jgi:imidazoleglycerol-phosphate dehydratase|uniref:imidazoleglycerol-phosphate dehydratase HisB n=1 Tax=Aggregatilinea sp. TaxID=2806333 RepID=UPI002C0D1AB2|nr:imidazoleglycerol-phosphate dehydratase HisB [Aggregatilinea sp.]HML22727.1 imidazoleglycerol-phosphate dehydratase HisB [Aggregatilinea sp.]
MMRNRIATITRNTNETQIELALNLDGSGEVQIDTGVGFLDHMLHHVAHHGLFDLNVKATGDLHIDAHHTIEDVGICLGRALDEALGERKGITRMGYAYVPMDEALARVVVDLSGRPYTVFEGEFTTPMMGQMPTSLVQHVFESIAVHGRMNLHAAVLYGRDDHHKSEALFKALGRALSMAVAHDPRRSGVPSTKGKLREV